MSKRMLIDASQPEETRVAIINGKTLEEFDFESFHKQTHRGNVYLAKVVRVEPSLQAAFVDYGQSRHGFLPFTEIHPDYFRIPVSDREALAAAAEESREDITLDEDGELSIDEDEIEIEIPTESSSEESESDGVTEATQSPVRSSPYRKYKIQEVVSKGQVILVQVVKEERGQKGAAMTSYLSLAGRYCVLMPNSRKGGGISRKISSAADRKRLKTIVDSLEVPETMGLIVRTAGQGRNKTELKRDSDYLKRLWNDIREKTLNSIAPALVYEEGDLIQKSIRDTYNKEIEEVLVQGKDGCAEARKIMKTFMPSHVRRVKEYREDLPLLQAYGVNDQIDGLYTNTVDLPSGGSIVINPTEALIAIDINSGKSKKDRHIDETAYRTNIEAAQEIARQLRLRDLSGLIVIDFIDMESKSHIQNVERKLKESLSQDRARIQLGRISQFGLFEMSRQRTRPSFFESNTLICPHCEGKGFVRSIESRALEVLRYFERLTPGEENNTTVITSSAVMEYLLNTKKKIIVGLEEKLGQTIEVRSGKVSAEDVFILADADHSSPASSARKRAEKKETSKGAPETNDQKAEEPPKRSKSRRRNRKRGGGEDAQKERTEASKPAENNTSEAKPEEKKRSRNRRRSNNKRTKTGNENADKGDPSPTGEVVNLKSEGHQKAETSQTNNDDNTSKKQKRGWLGRLLKP